MSNTFLGSWICSAVLCILLIWPVLRQIKLNGEKVNNYSVLEFSIGLFIPVLNLMLCMLMLAFLVYSIWPETKFRNWLEKDFAYFKQS